MMNNKTILITGGTGLVGRKAAEFFVSNGYDVIILSRNPAKQTSNNASIRFAAWDVAKGTIDDWAIRQADAILHLAGAGVVDKPWTDAYKHEIIASRTKGSALIAKALQTIENRVTTVVSASAIGWYGADKTGKPFVESDPPSRNFLGETCRLWEESIRPVSTMGKRLVIYRIGIVLAREGGAFAEFVKPLRFRVAAVLGNGKQIVSWIHVDDLCRMFLYAIENTHVQGIYNAVAPHPVSNKVLTLSIAKAKYGKAFISMPVPAFVLKIMLGARSIEVLKSTTVSSRKILDAGFQFQYPLIENALKHLVAAAKQ